MITKRQYKCISYFLTRCLFFGSGFSHILNYSGNDSISACIIGFIIGILIMYYLFKTNINGNLINKGNKITNFIIFIFCILLINNILLTSTTFTSTFFLPKTPVLFIAIILL